MAVSSAAYNLRIPLVKSNFLSRNFEGITKEEESFNNSLLHTPRYRLEAYGGRTFTVRASRLWNNLPHNIRGSDDLVTYHGSSFRLYSV